MAEKPSSDQVYYTCRKCSTHLFDRNAVLHEGTSGHQADGIGVSNIKASWGKQKASFEHGVGGKCSSVFTGEAPQWASELTGNEGRITCPKCSSRVGSFSWSGAPCSCGKWVTPAFQFQLSRIDPKGLVNCDHIVAMTKGNALELAETTQDASSSTSSDAVNDCRSSIAVSTANGR